MRTMLLATAALTLSSAFALAAPASVATTAPTNVDFYAFAGGRDAAVTAPLQTGRSAADSRAFTAGDTNHAFAPWGFAD